MEDHNINPENGAVSGLGIEFERPRVHKAAGAFRTISEVADELHVPQHVLRFWESKFPQVRPLKRGGGRRYYRPEDVVLLRRVADLLYTQGYTIKGVQRLMRDHVVAAQSAPQADISPQDLPRTSSTRPDSLKRLAPHPVLPLPNTPKPVKHLPAELAEDVAVTGFKADDAQHLRAILLETLSALEALRKALD